MATASAIQQGPLLSDRVATFCIETAEEMGTLGKLFGGQFMHVGINCNEDSAPVIVSLYGMVGSGKTYFSQTVLNCFDLPDRFKKISKTYPSVGYVGNRRLLYYDFGSDTYEVLSGEYSIERFGKEDLSKTYDIDPLSLDGTCIFEHSPAPHLTNSDIVILISNLEQSAYTKLYLSNLKYMINEFMVKTSKNDLLSSRIDNLMEITASSPQGKQDRIVDVILTSDNEYFRDNFHNFKRAGHSAGLAL